MAISDLPILSMLRTRMQWHQERQRVLSENVANADTPKFRPSDLTPPNFDRPPPAQVSLVATNPAHLSGLGGGASRFASAREGGYEARPSGNAVSLEDEMLNVSQNQADFQLASSLYQKSLQMLRIAAGRGR